jgi:hypothetical protein
MKSSFFTQIRFSPLEGPISTPAAHKKGRAKKPSLELLG